MIRKNILKLMSLGITTTMALTMFVGCGSKEASNSNNSNGSQTTQSGKVSDKPIEISILMPGRPEGPISNDMPIIKEITNKTNIKFKWEQAPSDGNQYTEKFNILVASGDIPDIMVNADKEVLNRGGVNGVFEPLNDYMDKYMPNVKKALSEKGDAEKMIKNDNGKTYYLGRLTAVKAANTFLVRQDWLDKLGIKAPTTTDEMYNMLKLFKEKDPNGNGKNDEIPFTCRGKLTSLSGFMEGFGLYGKDAFNVENGKVKYTYTDARYKNALVYLNKLYKEKLIDNEYTTNDLNTWQSRLTNGTSGLTYDMFVRADFLNNLMKNDSNAKFTGVMPLKGTDGKAVTKDQQKLIGAATSVSSKSKYKVEIAKFFNWMYSEEGVLVTNFGVEGDQYTKANGQPQYTDKVMKDPKKSALIVLYGDGFRDNWPYKTDIRYENAMGSEQQNKLRDSIDSHVIPNYPDSLTYTDEERKVMTSKYTQIQTYWDEMANKFILGTESLDKFDDFAKKIDSMGIQDVLKVQQSAYDRFMKR
jgi:putative aldouronate transport system substrate-binding protein